MDSINKPRPIVRVKRTFQYTNPIYSKSIDAIRDCQILMDNDLYYLMGTCPPFWEGENPGVKIYSAKDLLNWKFERLLIDRQSLDPHVWYRDRFWAPEIHVFEGKYYLTFNCRNEEFGFEHSSGIAVADHILGPYHVVSHDAPLIKESNDLTIFMDDDGRSYVYRTGIWTQEIDLRTCRLVGEEVQCLVTGNESDWDKSGIEGPYVVKREGIYYLFYSSWTRGYEIGVATAKTPLGPWKKCESNPFFGAQDESACKRNGLSFTGNPDNPFIGAGHNAVFTGPDGGDWIVCHYQKRGGVESLGFDPLHFNNGVVSSKGPTHSEQVIELG
jgi:xylan 1,4-beta-xylosidase